MKNFWPLIGLNIFAALMNLSLFVMNLQAGKWVAVANLISGVFSGCVCYWLYKRKKQAEEDAKARVVGYLSGEIG